MVLRICSQPMEDVLYELRVLDRIARMGWKVASALESPFEMEGQVACLFPVLPGSPPSLEDPIAEQRSRGRLLAEFHADLANITEIGQRGEWRRCEEILSDPNLDRILSQNEATFPEVISVLRWHLERSRQIIAQLAIHARPGMIIHGDFTSWNLHYQQGELTGILDFELAHWDHRVAEFALSWRGKYDEVIRSYTEVTPLEPEEWELLTPMWWAYLINEACHHLEMGTQDDGWIMRMLQRRTPLMGANTQAFPQRYI